VVQRVRSGVLDDEDSSRYVWRLSGRRALVGVYHQRLGVNGHQREQPDMAIEDGSEDARVVNLVRRVEPLGACRKGGSLRRDQDGDQWSPHP